MTREHHLEGEVPFRELEGLLARPGWDVQSLADWAKPWVAFLDAHPALLASEGREATLAQVVFLGLYNGLLRVGVVAPPAPGVPAHIATLASETLTRLGFPTASETIHEWIAADYQLAGRRAGIARGNAMPFLPSLEFSGDAGAPAETSAPDRELQPRENEALLDRAIRRGRDLAVRLRAAARTPFEALGGRARLRIGAIVHCHYDELWPELAGYLHNATPLDEVYVSIREGAPSSLEAAIRADFPLAKVRRVANVGRDVLPFLEALELARRDGVELVCKVHGKRSAHVATGEAWRRDMLDKLLGSPATVQAILEAFRADATLGIVGPGGHVVPGSFYWERNAARVTGIAARMGLEASGLDFRYVAGTMFWARVAALAPLLALGLAARDFEPEDGAVDGTLVHAIERCFPLAARAAGMRTDESANPSGTTVRDFAP